MQIKKALFVLVTAVVPFALLGCPDKEASKPDPAVAATAAKAGAASAKPTTPAAPAAPAAASAKSGGGGW
jgi:hypothetical protein